MFNSQIQKHTKEWQQQKKHQKLIIYFFERLCDTFNGINKIELPDNNNHFQDFES